MNLANGHIAELTLRRRRAGETLGAEAPAIEEHATTCADCRARIRALDDEQRRFEDEISFDRFSAGVERAARSARPAHPPHAGRPARGTPGRTVRARVWMSSVAGMAAAAAALLVFVTSPKEHGPTNRIKGGAGVIVRVAGSDGQRTAGVEATEALARGERLRIGYQSGGHKYLLSLSIDDRGEVTPLYPERGPSLQVPDGSETATRFLPDSLELTGKGTERIVVVLSDQPIDVEVARRAARAAYQRAGGDVTRLPKLDLPGEQFVRTFAKP
jgi:hypothetical protein